MAISSTAPTSWPLTKERDVGCLADRLDDRSDDFAHGKRRVGVFRDRGAERRHVVLRRRKDGVGNRDVGVLVDPAASLDRAVVLEFELGPDEAVGELARFDIERLNVAGDLLLAAVEGDLQYTLARALRCTANDHAQVGSPGEGQGAGPLR